MKNRSDSKTLNTLTDLRDKTTANPFILLENVSLKIGEITLFQNLTWVIHSREHWAIIGPNGSGKSILAQAICHEVPFGEGRIVYYFDEATLDGNNTIGGDAGHRDNTPVDDHAMGINDAAITDVHISNAPIPVSQRQGRLFFNPGEIIMISPQTHQDLARRYSSYHQARWQSFEGADVPLVMEFLSGKSIEHRSPYEVTPLKTSETVYLERRTKAVQLLKIENLLERKIIHLSHGETRKVMLVRALMQAPKLLILDDPFGGLDQESRLIVSTTITALTADNSPQILLITSNQEEITPGITHQLSIGERGRIRTTAIKPNPQDQFQEHEAATIALASERELPQRTVKTANYSAVPESALQLPLINKLPPRANAREFSGNQVLVELSNINVSYGKTQILYNLNWIIRQGEHWALLGPNGAGKTTLLSLILADNPQAYSNHVILFGKTRGSGESIWDIKRQIGWISPELQMHSYQNLTCYETVCTGFFDSLGLYQECSAGQAEIAGYWMSVFGIAGLADRPFRTVSMGEQRLVLLARALVKSPLLLILDEPCHGLDPDHRFFMLDLLDLICRRTPVSIIYVTHYLDELPQGITHVLKLEQGRVVESGPRKIGT